VDKQAMVFMLKKTIHNHVLNFLPVNERLCKLRIKGKFNNITIISAYALTEDKETEIKEQFYEEIQIMIDNTPRSDTTIILGDFNPKLEEDDTYNNVTGKHTLHEQTSENGELLCEFATVNDMQVSTSVD
jgi:exonuclease III